MRPANSNSHSSGERTDNHPLTRRHVLRLGVPVTIGLAAVKPVSAEPIDGKGNDVCPCFFDITSVEVRDDETLLVSGPCGVVDPPEEATVTVHVRGEKGAQAIGGDTVICEGTTSEYDSFTVSAQIRGGHSFEVGDTVDVHARIHITSGTNAAITGRWRWSGAIG